MINNITPKSWKRIKDAAAEHGLTVTKNGSWYMFYHNGKHIGSSRGFFNAINSIKDHARLI